MSVDPGESGFENVLTAVGQAAERMSSSVAGVYKLGGYPLASLVVGFFVLAGVIAVVAMDVVIAIAPYLVSMAGLLVVSGTVLFALRASWESRLVERSILAYQEAVREALRALHEKKIGQWEFEKLVEILKSVYIDILPGRKTGSLNEAPHQHA